MKKLILLKLVSLFAISLQTSDNTKPLPKVSSRDAILLMNQASFKKDVEDSLRKTTNIDSPNYLQTRDREYLTYIALKKKDAGQELSSLEQLLLNEYLKEMSEL